MFSCLPTIGGERVSRKPTWATFKTFLKGLIFQKNMNVLIFEIAVEIIQFSVKPD